LTAAFREGSMSAAFHAPRLMLAGGGAIDEASAVLQRIGVQHPLIVADPYMQSCGLLQRLIDILARAGIAADSFVHPVPDPTGTGAEATRFCVITDTANDEKMLIAGLGCLPVAAIVDFELTLTAPFRLTADTGIDALTHAIEAYVSRRANPMSDIYALAAMRT